MTHHDDEVRLRHMLDHAREAISMVQGKKRADLRKNRILVNLRSAWSAQFELRIFRSRESRVSAT